MSRAQTGVSPGVNKNVLIHLYRVPDISMCSMSIGKVAAMIPGLANDIRKAAPGYNLTYAVGFGPQLWSFTWQGNHPPGFRALQASAHDRKVKSAGSDFIFFVSANLSGHNENLAGQCQPHLKKIVKIRARIEGEILPHAFNCATAGDDFSKTILISNRHPEFAQGSFLLNLSFFYNDDWKSLSKEDQATQIENFSREVAGKLAKEPGFLSHFIPFMTAKKTGLNFLAFCNRMEPFQHLLDLVAAPAANPFLNDWMQWVGEVRHSQFFVPSIDLLTGLRMGGLRIGSLSPTAPWK